MHDFLLSFSLPCRYLCYIFLCTQVVPFVLFNKYYFSHKKLWFLYSLLSSKLVLQSLLCCQDISRLHRFDHLWLIGCMSRKCFSLFKNKSSWVTCFKMCQFYTAINHHGRFLELSSRLCSMHLTFLNHIIYMGWFVRHDLIINLLLLLIGWHAVQSAVFHLIPEIYHSIWQDLFVR